VAQRRYESGVRTVPVRKRRDYHSNRWLVRSEAYAAAGNHDRVCGSFALHGVSLTRLALRRQSLATLSPWQTVVRALGRCPRRFVYLPARSAFGS